MRFSYRAHSSRRRPNNPAMEVSRTNVTKKPVAVSFKRRFALKFNDLGELVSCIVHPKRTTLAPNYGATLDLRYS